MLVLTGNGIAVTSCFGFSVVETVVDNRLYRMCIHLSLVNERYIIHDYAIIT